MSGSCLYVGSVMHRRVTPRRHWFRYEAFWLLVDVADLDALSRRLRFFSFGRPNLFGLSTSDFGDGSDTPLSVQVKQALKTAGFDLENGKISLLCMPRILGYCFNPLSIFFCYRPDGTLAATVYEVHNTFGERHRYVIAAEPGAAAIHQSCNKAFHVSPFLDMDMRYDFSIRPPSERVAVAIRVSEAKGPVMTACLAGERRPLTDRALLGLFLAIPFLTFKVTLAIHWHALRLWMKGLKVRPHSPAEGLAERLEAS